MVRFESQLLITRCKREFIIMPIVVASNEFPNVCTMISKTPSPSSSSRGKGLSPHGALLGTTRYSPGPYEESYSTPEKLFSEKISNRRPGGCFVMLSCPNSRLFSMFTNISPRGISSMSSVPVKALELITRMTKPYRSENVLINPVRLSIRILHAVTVVGSQ